MKYIQLSETERNKLVGGFSQSLQLPDMAFGGDAVANNCNGGNCLAPCKSKRHKKAPGSNSNCKGNCVPGCGKKG